MEPLNQNEEIVTFEMFRDAIIEAALQIHQNANTHMETVNQDYFNENQVHGQHGLPFSVEMQSDSSQSESVNFQFSTEQSLENISLEKHQMESDNSASLQISTEEDLCDENQMYPLDLDILRFGWEEQTINSELQSQNVIYDIEQPSCSNVINSNINKVNLSHQTVDDNSNACEICNGKFISRYDLNRHMLIHSGEKPFSCNFCNMKSNRLYNLKSHMKIMHSIEEPVVCRICCRGFSQKVHLQSHILDHTVVEKPFICSDCGRGFSQKAHLQSHMFKHTGEKPHICDICKKGYAHKSSLKKHMLTHAKPKYFKR